MPSSGFFFRVRASVLPTAGLLVRAVFSMKSILTPPIMVWNACRAICQRMPEKLSILARAGSDAGYAAHAGIASGRIRSGQGGACPVQQLGAGLLPVIAQLAADLRPRYVASLPASARLPASTDEALDQIGFHAKTSARSSGMAQP